MQDLVVWLDGHEFDVAGDISEGKISGKEGKRNLLPQEFIKLASW